MDGCACVCVCVGGGGVYADLYSVYALTQISNCVQALVAPRNIISSDLALPHQKQRKQLSTEQMKKRREDIAKRLSRRVDPATLHKFASGREEDQVMIVESKMPVLASPSGLTLSYSDMDISMVKHPEASSTMLDGGTSTAGNDDELDTFLQLESTVVSEDDSAETSHATLHGSSITDLQEQNEQNDRSDKAAAEAARLALAEQERLAAEEKARTDKEAADEAARLALAEQERLAAEEKARTDKEAAEEAARLALAEQERLAAEEKARTDKEAAEEAARLALAEQERSTVLAADVAARKVLADHVGQLGHPQPGISQLREENSNIMENLRAIRQELQDERANRVSVSEQQQRAAAEQAEVTAVRIAKAEMAALKSKHQRQLDRELGALQKQREELSRAATSNAPHSSDGSRAVLLEVNALKEVIMQQQHHTLRNLPHQRNREKTSQEVDSLKLKLAAVETNSQESLAKLKAENDALTAQVHSAKTEALRAQAAHATPQQAEAIARAVVAEKMQHDQGMREAHEKAGLEAQEQQDANAVLAAELAAKSALEQMTALQQQIKETKSSNEDKVTQLHAENSAIMDNLRSIREELERERAQRGEDAQNQIAAPSSAVQEPSPVLQQAAHEVSMLKSKLAAVETNSQESLAKLKAENDALTAQVHSAKTEALRAQAAHATPQQAEAIARAVVAEKMQHDQGMREAHEKAGLEAQEQQDANAVLAAELAAKSALEQMTALQQQIKETKSSNEDKVTQLHAENSAIMDNLRSIREELERERAQRGEDAQKQIAAAEEAAAKASQGAKAELAALKDKHQQQLDEKRAEIEQLHEPDGNLRAMAPPITTPQRTPAVQRSYTTPNAPERSQPGTMPKELIALHEKLRVSEENSDSVLDQLKAVNAAINADMNLNLQSNGMSPATLDATPVGPSSGLAVNPRSSHASKENDANLALTNLKEDLTRRRLFDTSAFGAEPAQAPEPIPQAKYCANDVDELLKQLGVQGRFVVIRHSPNKPLGLQLSFDANIFPNAVRVTDVKGAAAEAGDLRVNDTILEINGQSMMDATHTSVVETLRGMCGRDVGLLVVNGHEISAAYMPYLESDTALAEDGTIEPRAVPSQGAATPDAFKVHGVVESEMQQLHPHGHHHTESSMPAYVNEPQVPAVDPHGQLATLQAKLANEERAVAPHLFELDQAKLLDLEKKNAQLASSLQDVEKRAEATVSAVSRQIADESRAAMANLKFKLEGETSVTQQRMEELQSANHELTASLAQTQYKAAAAAKLDAEMDRLRAELEASQKKLGNIETQRIEDEMLRRKLHHTIQELKGNIRVYCRIRPFMEQELLDGSPGRVIHPSDSKERITIQENAGSKVHNFNFDNVFTEASTQADIFEEITPVLQSAIDGYNVCIFTYGQTGAGKTHTMQGGSGDSCGIIPRTVRELFKLTNALGVKGWSYTMQTAFLEIYNERLRDLLSAGDHEKLDLFHDPQTHEIIVSNLGYANLCDTHV